MRPNHDSTTLGDLKASSQILRNSCSARFREIKDISSGEMGVPEEPKDQELRISLATPCTSLHEGPFPQGTEQYTFSP